MKMKSAFFGLILLIPSLCPAQGKTEIGEINHAMFRIDVPDNWNHGLVIYCHGYDDQPVRYEHKALPPVLAVFVKAGYALAESGYSTGGWAIEQAIPDTEALRRYFIGKYGKPKEIFLTGHSMGGFLTMAIMEQYPETYDAGLALCGPLAAPAWFMQRWAFDDRVIFDYYFPGALPDPSRVPPGYAMSDQLTAKILRLLNGKRAAAAVLRNLSGAHSNKDLADGLMFATYVLKDLQQRAGGNPFDNRHTIYAGTPDDNTLNDKVHRYSAAPATFSYLQKYYAPTGKISRPILAIHTTYDPLVSPWIPDQYLLLTREAGTSALFVQQYVKHDGHCNISAQEVARGFDELRQWKEKGTRPSPGGLQ